MSPKRVLVLAAYYPPSTAAAAIRARNIVHNLQSLGHDVSVVTARTGAPDGTIPVEAQAVGWLDLDDLARRRVRRQKTESKGAPPPPRSWERRLRSVASRVLVPDLRAPWIPMAALAARRAIGSSDVVLSTGAGSAHLAARMIRGMRPWVVDINDIWWRNPHRSAGALRERVDRRVEETIVTSASALIVPNDALSKEVERRWGYSPVPVFTGFDPREFEVGDQPRTAAERELIFAGTLYSDFRLDLLFEALALGRERDAWSPAQLRVLFIGSGAGRAVATAVARGVDDFVEGLSPIPRQDLLARLVQADALLLPLYPSDPFHLPMRFFDFVGSGRPIIGVGSDRAPAAEMIQRHGLGFVCRTSAELASVLDEVVRHSRLPEVPSQTRRLFDAANERPVLDEVLERVMRHNVRTDQRRRRRT